MSQIDDFLSGKNPNSSQSSIDDFLGAAPKKKPQDRSATDTAVDVGKSMAGSVLNALGAIPTAGGRLVREGGEMLLGLSMDEARTLAESEGRPDKALEYYERSNKLNPVSKLGGVAEALGGWMAEKGDQVRDSRSEAAKELARQSTPEGDITKPSTWTMGQAPSVEGAAHVLSDVVGSVGPQVATAVATRGRSATTQITAGGISGASQIGGAAIQEANEYLSGFDDDKLRQVSPVFRELEAKGYSPKDARTIITREAENRAGAFAAPVGMAGGAATGAILGKTGERIAAGAKGVGAKAAVLGVLGATEEGIQEVGEGVATRAGINDATGMDRSLTEGTFGEFVLGAAGGGGMGAGRGAYTGIKERLGERDDGQNQAPGAAGQPETPPGQTPPPMGGGAAATGRVPGARATPGMETAGVGDTAEAEKALRTPVNLTALDRANEIDTELGRIQARGQELTPENGYGPAFDGERGELSAQAQQLEQERNSITQTWPKGVGGAPASFSTEAGVKLEGQYALMDAADLVTSHDEYLRVNPLYPQELQPRDRSRSASGMQVSNIFQKLDPARLGLSADAATGAPIVGADGLVESGNARTIALKRAYQSNTNGQKAEDYKQFLRENAAQFGITPESVDGMAKPVLVRVRTTPVNRAEFARQANASTVQRMSPSEQALSDSKRLTSLEGLNPDDAGDFTASYDFIRQFMGMLPITEQSDLLESDGRLSTLGYRRIQNAVLAKAYGDSATLRRMTESMDDNLRNVTKALVRVAPTIASARERMQLGTMHEADIAPDLLAAVEGLSSLKEKGWSVADELGQGDLTGAKYSPEAEQLLALLSDNIRSPRRIAEFLQRYYEALEAAGDPSQASMFDDGGAAPARADLLKSARGNDNGNTAQDTQRRDPGEGARTDAQGGRQPENAPSNRGGDQGDGAARTAASDETRPASGQADATGGTREVAKSPDGEPGGQTGDGQASTLQEPQARTFSSSELSTFWSFAKALGYAPDAVKVGTPLHQELKAAYEAEKSPKDEKATAPRAVEEQDGSVGSQAATAANPELSQKNADDVAGDAKFPAIATITNLSVGPGGVMKPSPIKPGENLYRETSLSGLDDLLYNDSNADIAGFFVADNPDLALGQGDNKGVQVVFRPDALSGQENRKPGTGDIAGREYKTDMVAPRAVQTITMKAVDVPRMRGLARRALADFEKEVVGGGLVRYHRKGLPRYEPAALLPTTQPIVKKAAAKKADSEVENVAVKRTADRDFWAYAKEQGHAPAEVKIGSELHTRLKSEFDALKAGKARLKEITGKKINEDWTAFSAKSDTMGVPRADMPQIKAEHRGALTQFLAARGVVHESDADVSAMDLKPTQAEFSPSKVKQAQDYEGGDRSILVSADGFVLDGHHQWLAKLTQGLSVRVIRFNSPMAELLPLSREFPSAEVAQGAEAVDGKKTAEAKTEREDAAKNEKAFPGDDAARWQAMPMAERETLAKKIGRKGVFATGLAENKWEKLAPSIQAKLREAMGSGKQESAANEFIPAPDGGLDYGEITPEMSKAMGRQAGKIRLTQGVQNSDGTGHGLVHIEANHGEQVRALGFKTIPEFIANVANGIQQVWQVPGNSQLLVTMKNGRKDVMFIRLEIANDGDFYRVNSAFPVRQADYEDRRGMKKIWDGSEPTPAATGQQPAFATTADAAPESVSSQGSSNARGQGPSVARQADSRKAVKIEDSGEVLLSRGAGKPAARVDFDELKAMASRIEDKNPGMPPVLVLKDPSEIPERYKGLRDYIIRQDAWYDVDGAMHAGRLFLFASGLTDLARAEHVLLEHEGAHYGLRALLGDSLKTAMALVYANNADVRRAATALQKRGKLSNIEAVEEVIVDIPTAQLIKLKGWRKVTVMVRDWLQGHGFTNLADKITAWLDGSLTQQERADLFVAELVRGAREYIAGKRPRRRVGYMGDTRLSTTLAEDIERQEKWLQTEARARGFADIEDMLAKDYPLFEKLAALWRKKNPADGGVMLSRGDGQPQTKQLRELAKQARAGGNDNKTVALRLVSSEEADLLKSQGVDVDDAFTHTADMFAVRHALNRHGDVKIETKQGQLPIGEDDIAAIAQIVGAADALILGAKTPRGQDIVGSLKRLADGTVLYLEEVRSGRKTLAMTSMRKYPGTTDFDAIKDRIVPSYAQSDTGDVRIVYPNGGDSQTVQTRLSRAPAKAQGLSVQDRADEIIHEKAKAGGSVLDAAARTLTRVTRLEKITSRAYDFAAQQLDRFTPNAIKAGVVSDYGVPESVIDQRAVMQGRKMQHLRKVGGLLDKLNTLTRSESRVAYAWMNEADESAADRLMQDLPSESVKVLQEAQKMIDHLSREAVSLGQLSEQAYKAHRFAYLRRSYAKHVVELSPKENAKRGRVISVLGDQYKGRGLTESAPMAKIKATDWWKRKMQEGKADTAVKGEKFIRLERRASSGEGVTPLDGMDGKQPGRVLEVNYWPAAEPMPAKYQDWTQAGTFEARDTQGDKVVMWRDYTKDEREKMGEVDEARFAIAKTLHGMIHDVEVGRYLRWIAQTQAKLVAGDVPGPLVKAEEGWGHVFKPGEWVQVPDTKITGTDVAKYGKLAGRFIPGPVWNDVRQVGNSSFGKVPWEAFNTLQSWWKTSKTALSPGVHMNNIMSNFVMADWHDVSPAHVRKALRILMAASNQDNKGMLGAAMNAASKMGIADREAAQFIVNRYKDSGGELGSWATVEMQNDQLEPILKDLQKELGIEDELGNQVGAFNAMQQFMHAKFPAVYNAAGGLMGSTLGRVGSKAAGKVVGGVVQEGKTLIDLYQSEDEVFRLAAWLKSKEAGMDDMAAGKVSRKSFLDYSVNAPWIVAMKNSAWPFMAFSYRAIPMFLETAGKKPHKLLKLMAVAGALNAMGAMLAGGDDDEDELRKLLPEEKAGRIWGMVPKLIRMPWNDAHGSPVFLDVRRFVPVGDVFDVDQGHSAIPLPPALQPGGIIGMLGEVTLNKSAFTGKPITLETDAMGERSAKVLDYMYKWMMPNVLGVPGSYATTGVQNAYRGKEDPFGREQSIAQAISSAFGLKLGSYPTDVLRQNLVKKTKAESSEIDHNITKLSRQYQQNGISREEFDEGVQYQLAKKTKLWEEMGEKMR